VAWPVGGRPHASAGLAVVAFGGAALVAATLPALTAAQVDCPSASPQQRGEAIALYEQGRSHLLQERWAEAAEALEAAVRLDPGVPLAHYGLGQARLSLSRPADALAAFQACRAAYRCALASPDTRAALEQQLDAEAAALRAEVDHLGVEYQQHARVQWKEMNGPGPTTGDSVKRLHELDARLGALEQLRRDGLREPPELAFALGNASFLTGALDAAEREFRRALAARPGWGDAHLNLAVTLLALGRLDEAEAEATLAKKAGVPVPPRFAEEIRKRRKAGDQR
jgi:tetratricopeptide (TPR) repeat protein